MKREDLIQKTLSSLDKLSDEQVKEIADYAEFLLSKIDNAVIIKGIYQVASDSKAFQFLEEDKVQYSKSDLKEAYK